MVKCRVYSTLELKGLNCSYASGVNDIYIYIYIYKGIDCYTIRIDEEIARIDGKESRASNCIYNESMTDRNTEWIDCVSVSL